MLAATAKLLRELPSGQEAVLPSCLEVRALISAHEQMIAASYARTAAAV